MLIKYLFLSVLMQMGAHFEAQTECVSWWLSGDQGINYSIDIFVNCNWVNTRWQWQYETE